MKGIRIESFGNTWSGKKARRWVIENQSGAQLSLTDFGARITGILMPDKNGVMKDVVLGFDSPEEFTEKGRYFGATVGRYANRIEYAEFWLNNNKYELDSNRKNVSLHGGESGFDDKIWEAEVTGEDKVCFRYKSRDGEEGYPGNLDITVCYRLTEENAVIISYQAQADDDTIINLTNHAFFNLKGHGEGSILDHELMIDADFYTPVNSNMAPDGTILPVAGTVFDFRTPCRIGERIDQEDQQLKLGEGYDHNYVLNKRERGCLTKAASVYEPKSGRRMTVLTDQPGLQFYSGNGMKPCQGKNGRTYERRDAFCLETQLFPNSMRVSHFPTPVLRKGEVYRHRAIYQFDIVKDKVKEGSACQG